MNIRVSLTALVLLAGLCTISWAAPDVKIRPEGYTSAIEPAPGQWFDLIVKIDPKGGALTADGLAVAAAAYEGATFGALILPAPDKPGVFTKAFTARLPAQIASDGKHQLTVVVKGTLDGKPFTGDHAVTVRLNPAAKRHVTASAALKAPAVAGEANAIVVTGEVKQLGMDAYHVYGTKADPSYARALVARILPAPGGRGAPWRSKETSPEGKELTSFSFEIPFTPLAEGKQDVRVMIEWQACTDTLCDDPEFEYVPLSFEVAKGSGVIAPEPEESTTDEDSLVNKSLFELALLAIAGGLFALAMPCTYPMIPITISFFTKQTEKREGRTQGLAFAYGLGIVAIFTFVGVAFGPPIIAFATLWWVNLIFALLFLVFGLSLIGLFDISLPGWLNDLAYKVSGPAGGEEKKGFMGLLTSYGSVFAMGTTLVITSFTCTAPIIGLVLVLAGQGGSLGLVAYTMAVFGLTMAIPFVLLSLAPNAMQKMPRSGEWMKTLKVTLGIVELGLVLKFLSNMDLAIGTFLISRETFLVLWGLSFLIAALYLFNAFHLFAKDKKWSLGWKQGACAVLLLGLTGYLYTGAGGKLLFPELEAFLPALPDRKQEYTEPFLAVIKEDYEKGVAKATELGAPIFLDFTGFQ